MAFEVHYKSTFWSVAKFTDDSKIDQVEALLKIGELDAIFDPELSFDENQVSYDSEGYISVEENKGKSTIQLIKNEQFISSEKIIWENGE